MKTKQNKKSIRPFYNYPAVDRPALSDKNRTITYNQLIDMSLEKKKWLNELGYGPKHRICVQGTNCVETYLYLIAASIEGCGTTLPMNATVYEESARLKVNNANVIIRLDKKGNLASVEHRHFEPTITQDKEYMCYYSSGTTDPYGYTKCYSTPYELDENNWGCGQDSKNAYRSQGNPDYLNPEENRTIAHMHPHISWGQEIVFNTLSVGGWCYLIQEPLEYDHACTVINPTWITGFPLALQKIINSNKGSHKLNTVEFGGGPSSKQFLKEMDKFFKPKRYIQMYGDGVIGDYIANYCLRGEDNTHIGKPCDWFVNTGGKIKISKRGTLLVKGISTPGDDWYDTNDIIEIGNDGNMRYKGRAEEIFINRGGGKLYPWEIADYISRHPKINDCYIYPIKDKKLGQIPGCVYSGDIDPKEFDEYVRSKVAKWQVPVKYTRVKDKMNILVRNQYNLSKISLLRMEQDLKKNKEWIVDEY